jgi:hypothetical protein
MTVEEIDLSYELSLSETMANLIKRLEAMGQESESKRIKLN